MKSVSEEKKKTFLQLNEAEKKTEKACKTEIPFLSENCIFAESWQTQVSQASRATRLGDFFLWKDFS
jgi:hypothetical protein